MGLNPVDMPVLDRIIRPGASVITVGRLVFRKRFAASVSAVSRDTVWFDEIFQARYPGCRLAQLAASPYEGATLIQDLNMPLAEENAAHVGAYDVLIDGGTIEHVFDPPQAVRTYMALVRPGGHVYIKTPANNHFGHGFYQFGSEFFYRAFAPEHGFRVEDCFLETHPSGGAPLGTRHALYDAPDPATLGRRTVLVNSRPVIIHCLARKERDAPPVRSAIQSDYTVRWQGAGEGRPNAPGAGRPAAPVGESRIKALLRKLPGVTRAAALMRRAGRRIVKQGILKDRVIQPVRRNLAMNSDFPRRPGA